MRITKRFSISAILILAECFLNPATAQTLTGITAVPTSWLIQNYVPNQLVLWFTGSTCTNGQLVFPSTAIQADQDRLWATVLAAKATGQQIIVYYYVSGGGCFISSFGVPD
jgi:hypothetical protein